MRTATVAALAVLALLVLPPVGARGPAAAADTAPLSYAAPFYAVLDPARAARPNDERLVLALLEPLTAIDPSTGKLVPAAAREWQESPDGRTWTFRLRPSAKWSDGSPVKAADFVAAWRRALDPFDPSPWAWTFRRIDGAAAVADGERAMTALSEARRGLEALAERHPDGIPGKDVRALVEESGVLPFVEGLEDANLKRFLRWGTDAFPKDKALAVAEVLKQERRRVKQVAGEAFDAFGVTRGAVAKDDLTLEVHATGRCPWLPALLARAPFAPLHPKTVRGGETVFDAGELPTNGPFVLKGRGAKAHAGQPNPLSVVHLAKSPSYDGPRAARTAEILCFTGQGPAEDLRRLTSLELAWVADLAEGWREADAAVRDEAVKVPGYRAHPAGSVVLLRLRCDRPPFDRKEARLAFALAVDRAALARRLWPPAPEARRLVPPGLAMPGARPLAAPSGTAADAKRAFAAAKLDPKSFPWVELHFAERPGHDDLADALLGTWGKSLGVEMGLRIHTPAEMDAVLRAGAFGVAVGEVVGVVGDPEAYVGLFEAGHPQCGLGWKDDAFRRLLDGARDVDAFVAAGDAATQGLPDSAELAVRVRGAGSAGGREALRLALLEAAERRLLDEAVVVPLLLPVRAEARGAARGAGEDAAWDNPAFLGSLPDLETGQR